MARLGEGQGSRFLCHLSSRLDKWRLLILVFVTVYGVVLSLNLGGMSMQWDEVNHFNGGLLFARGQFDRWVWTNSFYPPMFDLFTAFYFLLGGASVFASRLVAVTFSLLSVVAVFELARKMYSPITAFVASVLFGVMPGIVWLSRMAMIETMLMFFFLVSMFFFFQWLQTNRDRDRLISIVAFVVGVAVKYQMLIVVPLIALVGMVVLGKRAYLKAELARYLKFPRLLVVVLVAVLAGCLVVVLFASGVIDPWLYAIQVGTADKSIYSVRYPVPVFYLVEMTYIYSDIHPVSLLLYAFGLAGLGLLAYRRKPQDKFLLLWFAVIYVVFTLIPNRQWRYVTLAFPVLAISASSLLASTWGRAQKVWQSAKSSFTRRNVARLAAALLVVFTVAGVFFSCYDAYYWVTKDDVRVPVEQATAYAAQHISPNESIMVVCPLNFLNNDMVWFYLNAENPSTNQVWQYPQLAVDSYTPNFNTTELISLCHQRQVRYVFLYENGASYFGSDLTEQTVYNMLVNSGRFTQEVAFGLEQHRVFVMSFS